MRTRTQTGYVWKVGQWWWIRFNDTRIENGVAVRKQRAQKLCEVEPDHRRMKRPPEVVKNLQDAFMQKINDSRHSPEHGSTLADFVTRIWFPSIETRLAASTVHEYRGYWQRTLAPRCGPELLRDFSTRKAQAVLDGIARDNHMTKATLHKLKSILSKIFKFAIQKEYLPRGSSNPIRDCDLPKGKESGETIAYDLDTTLAMLRLVPEPSRTVIAVAAFAGLRRGEIEGLLWENYDGENLAVTRAMWHGIAGEPKTKQSRSRVPVIAALRRFLDQHRLTSGNPSSGIMFVTRNNTPLSMNNLLNDQIRPALDRCACGLEKIKHGGADHDYTRDKARPEWHGFHAFRRGLATNLHALGVDDLTVQRILRHSNVGVTQQCYIKVRDAATVAAMDQISALVDGPVEIICNESAKNAEKSGVSRLVN